MMASRIKKYIKGAGLTVAAAAGLFLFAGTSNAQYGGYGYPNPQPNYGGYGNYGGYNGGYDRNEQKRIQRAYEKGVKDGRKQAERDARGGGYNRNNGGWTNSNLGGIFGGIFNNGRYGRDAREEQAYNDGYRQGYQQASYNDRGYRNNGRVYNDDDYYRNHNGRGHGRGNRNDHRDRERDDDDDDDNDD